MGQGNFTAQKLDAGIHRPIELLYNQGIQLVALVFGQQW